MNWLLALELLNLILCVDDGDGLCEKYSLNEKGLVTRDKGLYEEEGEEEEE